MASFVWNAHTLNQINSEDAHFVETQFLQIYYLIF